MWRVTVKGLLAKKIRLVLTSIAVVLGVAFMSGTFVLTDTLGDVFDNLFTETTKGIDAVVRAKQTLEDNNPRTRTANPVPQSLVPIVEQATGVRLAHGAVQGYAAVVGKDGKVVGNNNRSSGFAWLPLPFGQSNHIIRGHEPRADDEFVLDENTADDSGYALGAQVPIVFQNGTPEKFDLVGVFRFGNNDSVPGSTSAGFTPTTALRVVGREGQWDWIDVAAKPGVSQQALARNIRQTLAARTGGTTYEVLTGKQFADERANNVKDRLGFLNTFLLVFAVIALFVGSFIIYNTFSIIVAQRSRELALLRALGASGKQVTRSVAAEAFVVGLLSSAIGLALGVLVAIGLQGLLAAFGFQLPSEAPVILPRTVIVALLAGTIVTFVSALSPARRAARVPPVAAMRETAAIASSGARRYRIGGLLTTIGVVLLGLGLFGNVDSSAFPGGAAGLVGFAAFLVFIGVAMLSPLVARPVSRVLGWVPARFRGMSGVLARENAMRNPRRTATTASALMIGLALVTLVAIIGASAKQSFSDIIDSSVRAEWLIQGKGFFNRGFTPAIATSLREELPDAQVVEFRSGDAKINGDQEQLLGVTPNVQSAIDIKPRPGADLRAFANSGVLVNTDTAKSNGWHRGDTIEMQFERTGVQRERIQGLYGEDRSIGASYLISTKSFERNFTEQTDALVAVRNAPGASDDETRAVIEKVLKPYPTVEVQDQTEFKDSQIAQFNTILNLLYVMLLLAVLIALIGIVNTLALSIFERTRELGLLRAVGMTRAQVRTMIRDEAVIISIFGSLLGLAIGLAFGRALVSAVGDQGITFALPGRQLVLFVILAGIAGYLAGAWPARRAARREVLESIATE
ncbi:MAG TPA: FtsX-like permease family protein [Acidimicrobiia bacterium]|nr:FtsX-like permease family protein [Acidimicrobiia bacterium]